MSSGIYVATAGAVAQSNALDATANNIANAATAGFHGDRVTFKEALTAARSPDVAVVGAGTSRVDTQAGALTQTENPLDLALEGDGFFAVQTPQGTRYTRAGNFQLDAERQLVTSDGHPLRGEGGSPITIPPDASAIAVSAEGEVTEVTSDPSTGVRDADFVACMEGVARKLVFPATGSRGTIVVPVRVAAK